MIFGTPCTRCGKRALLFGIFNYKCFKCWRNRNNYIKIGGVTIPKIIIPEELKREFKDILRRYMEDEKAGKPMYHRYGHYYTIHGEVVSMNEVDKYYKNKRKKKQ